MRHLRALIITLAVLAVITFLTLFPGNASVQWLGYQIDFPIALIWISLALVMVTTISAIRIWDAIIHMPHRMQHFLEKRRTNKAEKMLLEGLTALAAQQLDEARSCVAFAQKLIPHHPLTAYVAAQSAHLAQDSELARTSFLTMTQHSSVAFLGYRGLIRQAQEVQDWHRVHQLLETVYSDRPDSPWVIQNILRNSLYLAEKEVLAVEVQSLLKSVYRSLPKAEAKHHEALVLWLQAQLVSGPEKQTLLHQSHEKDASLACVTAALVDLLVQIGDMKQARKIVKKNVITLPHRLIYSAWRKAYTNLTPVLFYASLEKELSGLDATTETRWFLFKAAIDAHMWGEAEKHGHALLENGDDRDVCLALASMFASTHGAADPRATTWQTRALDAMWTHFWVCNTCSAGMVHWHPICPSCRHTDSLTWKQQPLKEVWHTLPVTAPVLIDTVPDVFDEENKKGA